MDPSSKIDWSNLTFGYQDVNGYIMYTWKDGKWNDGEVVKGSTVPIHICSPALNYGQQCFEGLKAFRMNDGKVRIFRPQENSARLQYSAKMLSMAPVPESIFLEACRRCVALNIEFVPPSGTGQSMYLRPVLFSQGPQLGLTSPDEFIFIVFGTPVASYYKTGIKPVDAWIVDDFDRASPLGTGSCKAGGNYAPVFRPMKEAKEAGYPITLHLDSTKHRYIDEFSTSNFIGILKSDVDPSKKTTTLVLPKSVSILKSITAKSLLEIAQRQFEWEVEVRPVPFNEVVENKFSEIAAVGTAAIVTPIRSISYRPKVLSCSPEEVTEYTPEKKDVEKIEKIVIGTDGNTEVVGDHFAKLYKQYRAIQDGGVPDEFGWMWPKEGVTI